jgi:hypothetical protein
MSSADSKTPVRDRRDRISKLYTKLIDRETAQSFLHRISTVVGATSLETLRKK